MEQYYDIVCAVKVSADAKNEEKKHVLSFKSSKFSPRRGTSRSHFFYKIEFKFLDTQGSVFKIKSNYWSGKYNEGVCMVTRHESTF